MAKLKSNEYFAVISNGKILIDWLGTPVINERRSILKRFTLLIENYNDKQYKIVKFKLLRDPITDRHYV